MLAASTSQDAGDLHHHHHHHRRGGVGGSGSSVGLGPSRVGQGGPPAPPPHGHPHQQHHQQPPYHGAMESRNQSFDGGHYHGSFSRSDSMMSYEHHQGVGSGGGGNGPPGYDRHKAGGTGGGGEYHGPFPPHAPSWGSASSFAQGHYYGGGPPGGGGIFPAPARNYSDVSGGVRASSPSLGLVHHHHHQQRGAFQPPPEFRAPPSMVPKSGPSHSQQHILTSPYASGADKGSGSYGWSKDEDMRLTDIMKKYKSPRDWEPIAKEHNCGRRYVFSLYYWMLEARFHRSRVASPDEI
jgi:hypothetical protein